MLCGPVIEAIVERLGSGCESTVKWPEPLILRTSYSFEGMESPEAPLTMDRGDSFGQW
jgi:hypothetical protein